MKFNVEIDMNQFINGYDDDNNYFDDEMFTNEIKNRIAEHISDEIYSQCRNNLEYEINKKANEIIKNEIGDLKSKIIEIVADKIYKKRDLRELCTSDTKNKQFIEEVVNDCLRKKLGG